MNYLKKYFVTYKQALSLKELGFNEECSAWFFHDKINNSISDCGIIALQKLHSKGDFKDTANTEFILRPLYSQAFDWFRENNGMYHNIFTEESMQDGSEYYMCEVNGGEIKDDFGTYQEATNVCLDELIELCKNKGK